MRAHIWGSTLVADGKVFIGDEDGDFVTLAARKELQVLSKTLIDGKAADGPNLGAPINTTASVANGVLYAASAATCIAGPLSRKVEMPLANRRSPASNSGPTGAKAGSAHSPGSGSG